MNLQEAKREQIKLKLSLAGASGSGKTYTSLLLAYGICKDWSKIAVIDTENYSSSYYVHLGKYNVVNLVPPYSPERYIQAIQLCEAKGMEVIIIDSISHEWSGKGGCLEIHENEVAKMRVPNSFTAWGAVTPRHQSFIDAILTSSCHVIANARSKSEYVLTERNGKTVPQKVGMAPITRDGFEFEVSVAFELDQEHKAYCSKDRTGLFAEILPFVITSDTGTRLLQWSSNEQSSSNGALADKIANCKTIQELLELYEKSLPIKPGEKKDFEQQKNRLLSKRQIPTPFLNTKNISKNGTH